MTAEEVSTAVVTLVQDTSCQFAVRSGGHFIWPANNSEWTVPIGAMTKPNDTNQSRRVSLLTWVS